jgi:peptidoglycan-associated lipoprotein
VNTRALGLGVLVLLLGCQSTGGGDAETPESRGGAIKEEARTDPGLPGRSGLTRGGDDTQLETIFFAFDDASLRADAKRSLQAGAKQLEKSDVRIEIQGHCDERGTEEYNLALGQRRAEAARRYLRDLGISSSRIETKSFGESMPAVRGHGEAAWSKNRRDEFVVVR